MEEGLIAFIIWTIMGILFIVMGIYDLNSKKAKPFGFWANAETAPLFRTSNARYILLKVAEEYLEKGKNAQVLDYVYGFDVTEIMGKAIYAYYGAKQY